MRQGLMKGFEVLGGECVRAHDFHEIAVFALCGWGGGGGIRHGGLWAVWIFILEDAVGSGQGALKYD